MFQLRSDTGPAANCRHGGPNPNRPNGKIERLMPAILNYFSQACPQTAAMAEKLKHGQATPDEYVHLEVSLLETYWTRPEMAALVEPNSHKILFSMAVDATIDSDFNTARVFIRCGAFLREMSQRGLSNFVKWLHNQDLVRPCV